MRSADKVYVRPAEFADIQVLYDNMREADFIELEATCGKGNQLWAIKSALETSLVSWAWFYDGRLCCLMGVGSQSPLDSSGIPWLIGTNELDRHSGVLMRQSKRYIQIMHGYFPHLFNFVDVRNAKSIRWLKRLGFKFGDAVQYGVYGMKFYPFERVQ